MSRLLSEDIIHMIIIGVIVVAGGICATVYEMDKSSKVHELEMMKIRQTVKE